MSISNLLEGPNNYKLHASELKLNDSTNQLVISNTGNASQTNVIFANPTQTSNLNFPDPVSGSTVVVYQNGAPSVTQLVSITSPVELNTRTGRITTFLPSIAQDARVSFQLFNSYLTPNRNIYISLVDYNFHESLDAGYPLLSTSGSTGNGHCTINIMNRGALAIENILLISFLIV